MNENIKVLITGISGFIGSHTAVKALRKGYHVIGTLRDLDRAETIARILSRQGADTGRLEFKEADLLDSQVWNELMKRTDYVLHIASPFPRVMPKRDEALIKPAKQGTLHVLRAAAAQGVKRVVLTSSSGAISYGKKRGERKGVFSEEDWTDIILITDTTPYYRSKTIAEKAAWEFIAGDDSGLELTVICPGAVLGPVLEEDFGTSANIVIKTMDGSAPAVPQIGYDLVDVRSVADLQIRAMEMEAAAGERFIASAGYLSFQEIAELLRERYPDRDIPKGTLPDLVVRLISQFEPTLKPLLVELDSERKLDNSKARRILEWQPLPAREAVLATADSVIDLKLV